MIKRTFKIKTLESGKVAVYQYSRHYPRGVFWAKIRSEEEAKAYIARQLIEDAENRMARVADYLAERAMRPAPVKADTGQLVVKADTGQLEMF